MRLNIKLALFRFSSSLSGTQSSRLKSNSLLSSICASRITRAARFCSLDTRFTFSSDAVHHAHEPYSIIGLIRALKLSLRSARGRLRFIFFSTAIRCDIFLQMSSMCSVKLNWLSNFTPSSLTMWLQMKPRSCKRCLTLQLKNSDNVITFFVALRFRKYRSRDSIFCCSPQREKRETVLTASKTGRSYYG